MTATLRQNVLTNGSKSERRFVIAIASLGDYRANVVIALQKLMSDSLTICAGSPAYDRSIRLLDYQNFGILRLQNYYLPCNILIQRLPMGRLMSADTLVLDLNPRVPHVWFIVTLRRILGRRTMLWGHAWPHAGAQSRSDRVRGVLRRLATGLISYTESQAEELRRLLPGRPIYAAPNALYPSTRMEFDNESRRFRILYVGRLVAEKKPVLLLEAFINIASHIPSAVLTVVGDGPERATLQAIAAASNVAHRIEFTGYVSEFEQLRPIYAEAIVSVSPGYVGLSVTQTLAFGVPMVISRDENHSPEIEAVRPGFNAAFFNTNDAEALGDVLLDIVAEAPVWHARGPDIVADCRNRYSVERMANGLAAALTGEAG